MKNIRLVSYADENMDISQARLTDSFIAHGGDPEKVYAFGPCAIDTAFYKKNKDILDQERGAGYWLWKPYVIQAVLSRMDDGEWLLYVDSGTTIIGDVSVLKSLGDIVLFNNTWPHMDWCKNNVLQEMLPLFGAHPNDKKVLQVQASVILVRKTAETMSFVNEWLEWCQKPGFIDDSPSTWPNVPTFREHRHDQAILTNLAIKYNIPLHWWPVHYNLGHRNTQRYSVLFDHHRRRDIDWWNEAQVAEREYHNKDSFETGKHNYGLTYPQYFEYLGITPEEIRGKTIMEIGPADFPALAYIGGYDKGYIIEPMPSDRLTRMVQGKNIEIIKSLAESAEVESVDEVWIMNLLQHVIDPAVILNKCKKIAKVIRFFEPINCPVNVCHMHVFDMQYFELFFGKGVVKHYDYNNGASNFHTWECAYGVWEKSKEVNQ